MTPPLNWQEMYTNVLANAIINKETTLRPDEIPHVFGPEIGDENQVTSFTVNPDLWDKIPKKIQEELKAIWEGKL
jgi:copper oxidase (laccase) domain-containing protein